MLLLGGGEGLAVTSDPRGGDAGRFEAGPLCPADRVYPFTASGGRRLSERKQRIQLYIVANGRYFRHAR